MAGLRQIEFGIVSVGLSAAVNAVLDCDAPSKSHFCIIIDFDLNIKPPMVSYVPVPQRIPQAMEPDLPWEVYKQQNSVDKVHHNIDQVKNVQPHMLRHTDEGIDTDYASWAAAIEFVWLHRAAAADLKPHNVLGRGLRQRSAHRRRG